MRKTFYKDAIDRRELIRRTTGALAITLGGGVPSFTSVSAHAVTKDLSKQTLRTIGSAASVQDRILAAFKQESGVGRTIGTAASFPDAQTKILSGAKDFDTWETLAERLPALVQTKRIDPIATSELKNWSTIRDVFVKTEPKWGSPNQLSGQIWADSAKTKLWMVPTIFNFDSIGYNPSVVSDQEANSWTCLFDKKWKGRAGLNTDPLIAIGEAVLAMNSLGLSKVKNPADPSKAEINEAIKFLTSKKKEGQFRALWGDFGELVNLLASGEMVVCDAWQPAVMAVKAQGKPCRYAVPKEGYRGWALGPTLVAGSPNREAVIAYADYWLSGPPGVIMSEQGYYSPARSVEKAFSAQWKYDFWYEGKPWKGAPERGIKEGDLRDGGSLATRSQNVAYWHQWPSEYDHLIKKWDEFLSA